MQRSDTNEDEVRGHVSLVRIWGVTFESPVDLPGSPVEGPADVRIRFGAVPAELPDVRTDGVAFQAAAGLFRLSLPGIATYLVAPDEIVIDREGDADDDSVRLLLLGTPMAALLHLRERLPLHASAVEIDGHAVVLAGASATGKSALAAALALEGHRVVADDVAALHIADDGSVVVEPGPSELLLWRDTLRRLDLDPAPLRVARPGVEKFRSPATPVDGPLAVECIYLLGHRAQPGVAIEPVDRMAVVAQLLDQVRGSGFLDGLGASQWHFQITTTIMRRVPTFRLTRDRSGDVLDVRAAVLAHRTGSGPSAGALTSRGNGDDEENEP